MLVYLAGARGSVVASGAREEMVSSIHGGNPYLLVFKDPTGASDLEPGLYTRSDEGRWVQAFRGETTPAPLRGGFHLQLEMGHTTRRFEGIAVLNGRLLIFGTHSRQDDPKTFIAFGPAGEKLWDPTTENLVEVPAIEDPRDLSLFETIVTMSGETHQVVMISMKHQSPLGTGLTYALVFKPNENSGREMKLAYQPILLDWQFLNQSEIANRFLNRGDIAGFDSRNLAKKLSRIRPEDPAELALWRSELKKVVDEELSLRTFEEGDFGRSYPYLMLEDGRIEIDHVPSLLVEIAGRKSLMVYDPIDGHHGIYLDADNMTYRESKMERPYLAGAIDTDDKGNLRIEDQTSTASVSGHLSLVRMSHSWPYLMTLSEGKKRKPMVSLMLKPTEPALHDELPTDFSWRAIEDTNLIVVSWKLRDEASTAIYELDTSDYGLRVVNQIAISSKYYSTRELYRRAVNTEGVLTFDDETPLMVTEEEYREQHKLTKPHIDILGSLKKNEKGVRELRHYYPMPLEEFALTGRFQFRRYESNSGVETRSGIYSVTANEDRDRAPLVRGELVKSKLNVLTAGVLAETSIESPQSARGDVNAVLVDPRMESGLKGVHIVLLYSPYDREHSAQSLKISADDFSVQDLVSFNFIQYQTHSKKQNERQARFLAYLTLKSGVTKILSISLEARKDQFALKKDWERVVVGLALPPEEIISRLRIDGSEEIFWLKSPELEDQDAKQILTRLSDGKEIYGRSLKLRRIQDHDVATGRSIAGGTWRVLSGDDEDRMRTDRLKGASEYQLDAFPDLRNLLEEMADIQKPARHIIYIVPDELEKYAEEYPFALRVRDSDRPDHWSHLNYRLQLSRIRPIGQETLQSEVMDNFDSMREASGHSRPVLFGTLKDIKQISRPKIETNSHDQVKKPFILNLGVLGASNLEQVQSNSDVRAPHLLYLIATEGKRHTLTDFRPKQLPRMIPTLLVGTRRQLQDLAQDAGYEEPFGLFQDFEIRELEPPTVDRRMSFMVNVLKRSEVRLLGYTYDLDGFLRPGEKAENVSAAEAEARFIEYIVNRAQILSRNNGLGVFEGFMRVMNVFGNELTANNQIRRERKLSKAVAEKILSKVFSMPLNVELLGPTDFLKILLRRDAPFLMQQAGYHAPIEFIRRGIRTILSQLTADDIKKRNSLILIGESGSGKTQYVKTLLGDVAKLKFYDLRGSFEDNRNAWVFFVEMKKVREGDKAASNYRDSKIEVEDTYTMADIDAHLDRFLLTENGHRGFIVLDDIREAPPKVRSHFLARLRSLQDNPTVTVRLGDRRAEITTRNLTPILTMNPTDVQEEIERFAGKGKTPTIEDVILASLSAPDGSDNLNRSFLARWGAIINLDVAPTQAKDPKLLRTAKKSAQDTFTNYRRLVFVSGESVREVTEAFPKYDFRTLVSPAAATMIQLPNREGPGIYIVVPRRSTSKDEVLQKVKGTGRFASESDQEGTDVEVYVQQRLKAIRVDGDYNGRIEFMKFLVSNFRRRAFDWLVRSAGADARFAEDPMQQQFLLAPLAQAVYRHLSTYPEPYLEEVVVDESALGVKGELEKQTFHEAWKRMIDTEPVIRTPLPPLQLSEESQAMSDMGGFLEPASGGGRDRIVVDQVMALTRTLSNLLGRSIAMKDWRNPPSPEEWLKSLTTQDLSQGDPAVKDLAEAALTFFKKVTTADGSHPFFIPSNELDPYKVMRLFAVAFDRAIYRLAWGKVTNFLIEGMQLAVGDLSKGQSPGVQHFLFEGRSSPLSAMDLGLVLGNARYQPFFEETQESEPRHHEMFMARCKEMIERMSK